jgi:hypothetical protein
MLGWSSAATRPCLGAEAVEEGLIASLGQV